MGECGRQNQDAARRAPVAQVEGPSHDPDDPQPKSWSRRDGLPVVAAGEKHGDLFGGVRLPVEMIADPEMELRSERLTDRGLVGDSRMGVTTHHDPGTVHDGAEARIDGFGDCLQAWGAGNRHRARTKERERIDTFDGAKRLELGRARVPDEQLELPSPAGGVEPSECGPGTASAGSS